MAYFTLIGFVQSIYSQNIEPDQRCFRDEMLDKTFALFTNPHHYYITCKLRGLGNDDAFAYIMLWLLMNVDYIPTSKEILTYFLFNHTEDTKTNVVEEYIYLFEKNKANSITLFASEIGALICTIQD